MSKFGNESAKLPETINLFKKKKKKTDGKNLIRFCDAVQSGWKRESGESPEFAGREALLRFVMFWTGNREVERQVAATQIGKLSNGVALKLKFFLSADSSLVHIDSWQLTN